MKYFIIIQYSVKYKWTLDFYEKVFVIQLFVFYKWSGPGPETLLNTRATPTYLNNLEGLIY